MAGVSRAAIGSGSSIGLRSGGEQTTGAMRSSLAVLSTERAYDARHHTASPAGRQCSGLMAHCSRLWSVMRREAAGLRYGVRASTVRSAATSRRERINARYGREG